MPMIGLFLVFKSGLIPGFNSFVVDQKMDDIYFIFFMIALFTFMIPSTIILIMKKLGKVSSIRMPYKEERNLPFLMTFASFVFFCFMVIKWYPTLFPPFIILVILGATFGVFLAFMINTFWKISIHMIGTGGFSGMMFGLCYLYEANFALVYIAILIAGFTGYSRVELKAHTMQQVVAGFIVGFASQLLLISIYA